jgi:hypothetical protein
MVRTRVVGLYKRKRRTFRLLIPALALGVLAISGFSPAQARLDPPAQYFPQGHGDTFPDRKTEQSSSPHQSLSYATRAQKCPSAPIGSMISESRMVREQASESHGWLARLGGWAARLGL